MKYSVVIINTRNEVQTIGFDELDYNSLMEMIFHELNEEIGDCKGRAWCGTCHVEALNIEAQLEPIEGEEEKTLSGLIRRTPSSRLSCQLAVDRRLNGMTFKMIEE